MKIILKIVLYPFFAVIFVFLLVVNLRLHQTPTIKKIGQGSINQDVLLQLHFLKGKLHTGTGEEMQTLFPEGFMFIHTLHGLVWADLLANVPDSSLLFEQGLEEINWALAQVKSEQAKAIFPQHLPLEYGAFYSGWSNYLLGKKLDLQKTGQRDSSEIAQFQAKCNQIYEAYQRENVVFLESYQSAIWQADNMVCIASLALHDKIFTPQYQMFITNWINKIQQHLDPQTDLIPHSARSESGVIGEGARGSSQSLILIFLAEIDPKFAAIQFQHYKKLFLEYRFGLPAIREYPQGSAGNGDIDSGPIIYDIGAVASIVGIRAFAQNKEIEMGWQIRNGIEAFGFPFEMNTQKSYLLGVLPMADVFIAWSNVHHGFIDSKPTHFWQGIFHLFSLMLIIFIYLIIRKLNQK